MQANAAQITRLLKTARGQLDGLLKMVEEDRYCIDISHQLLATQAILRRANRDILHAHLSCCVAEAVGENEGNNGREKIEEILQIIDKLTR